MATAQEQIQDFAGLQSIQDSYSGEAGSLHGVRIDPKTGLPENYGNLLSMVNQGMTNLGESQFGQTAQYSDLYAQLYNQLRDTHSDAELQDALGQFQQFAPQYQQTQQDMISQNRESDLSDVARLSGLVREGQAGAVDPRVQGLRDQMIGQAGIGLTAGGNMTPDEQRRANEQIRSALGARGISEGATGAGREALANVMQGNSLMRDRQGFAQGVIDSESAKQKDPFSVILGNPNQAASFGSNAYSNPAFAPSTQGMPDFFGQSFSLAGMAQNQQQYNTDTRNQQLGTALGIANADDYKVNTTGLPQLI